MATQVLYSYLLRASPFRMSPTSSFIFIPLKCSSCQAPIFRMDMSNERVQHRGNSERALGSCSPDLWLSLSAFLDGRQGAGVDSSESLLGFSASLFNDVNAFSMDKEDPPEYIPAPIQSAADFELSKQLENVLYVLRELLPGPICKLEKDKQLLEEASRLVHGDITIQDPLVRLKGKHKLETWLHILASVNAMVNLHDIYAERSIEPRCENCVHAIWTLSIPGELQSTLHISTFEGAEKPPLDLSLSGESKFQIDTIGQVVSIESHWYVPRGGEEMLETVKKQLVSLMQDRMHKD